MDGDAVLAGGECWRLPTEEDEEEVDADDDDDVAGEAADHTAAARSRAERTMSRV